MCRCADGAREKFSKLFSTHGRTTVSTRTSSSSNTSGTLMKEKQQPFQIINHSCDFKSTGVNGTNGESRWSRGSSWSRGTSFSLSSSRSTLASYSSLTISTLQRNNSVVCTGNVSSHDKIVKSMWYLRNIRCLTGGPANPAAPAGPTSPRSPCDQTARGQYVFEKYRLYLIHVNRWL